MKTYVALLRGVNVGGQKKVAMVDLRNWLGDLGFEAAQSVLQSGNLIFRGAARTGPQLEILLEAESAKRLDLHTDFFVRSPREWQDIVASNPFPDVAARDPGHLLVMLLKDVPSAANVKALQATITGPEVVRAGARHLYITYPQGIGTSRLTNAAIDKKLSTRGTGRNWNTILKMAALVPD